MESRLHKLLRKTSPRKSGRIVPATKDKKKRVYVDQASKCDTCTRCENYVPRDTLLRGRSQYTRICKRCVEQIQTILDEKYGKQETTTAPSIDETSDVGLSPLDQLVGRIGFKSYDEYLKSDHWLLFTARVRKTSCYCCDSKRLLQVHHITYKNIGAEMPEDVVTVCRRCHKAIHSISSCEGVPLIDAHDVLKWKLGKADQVEGRY